MANIRSVRGESAGLNKEDRMTIARLLAKAGYTVSIAYQVTQRNAKGKKEYIVVFEEK